MSMRKVEIRNISEIATGDHICNRMSNGLYHHEIVTKVFARSNTFEVIGFISGTAQYCCLRQVVRNFDAHKKEYEGKVYKIEYENSSGRFPQLFSNDEVVERATLAFQGMERVNNKYDIVNNNCEHFATWCKTGVPISFQVDALKLEFGTYAGIIILAASVAGPFGLLLAAGACAGAAASKTSAKSSF